jgi:hypothetical protein
MLSVAGQLRIVLPAAKAATELRIIVPQSRLSWRRSEHTPMASETRLRSLLFSITAGAALIALAAPALAFQEQSVGAGTGKGAAGAPGSQIPNLNLSLPDADKGTGTEVRIPGLGTLGVLPKLDFGLELLYGANDSVGARPDDGSQPSDVQIRATIKHRF